MFQFYDHCTVLGSKITAIFTNDTSSPLLVGIYTADNATVVGTHIDLMERPRCRFDMIGGQEGGKDVKRLSMKFSTRKFFGRGSKNAVMADDDLRESLNTGASELAYFGVYVGAPDSGDPGAIQVQIIIDYIVAFIEPKMIAQS